MSRLVSAIPWIVCSSALLISSCNRLTQTDNASTKTRKDQVAEIVAGFGPSDDQRSAMLAAKDTLLQQLSGRLMDAMSLGPAQAIAVCQREAPEIATAVGDAHGLQIGRVGVRLRNPNNTGPAWASSLIQSKSDQPVFANLSNGHAAALLPIKLQTQCLMCHGPQEQIAPVIQQQIDKLYPNDEATGFVEGELRGWIWIEKPPSQDNANMRGHRRLDLPRQSDSNLADSEANLNCEMLPSTEICRRIRTKHSSMKFLF